MSGSEREWEAEEGWKSDRISPSRQVELPGAQAGVHVGLVAEEGLKLRKDTKGVRGMVRRQGVVLKRCDSCSSAVLLETQSSW